MGQIGFGKYTYYGIDTHFWNQSPGMYDGADWLSASYDKHSHVGPFFHSSGEGTHDITHVHTLFGGSLAQGTAVTLSLQDPDGSTTAYNVGDGVRDQSADLSGMTYNTWQRHAFDSSRTISHGDVFAVVMEWDSAYTSPDYVRMRHVRQYGLPPYTYEVSKRRRTTSTGSWGSGQGNHGYCFECSDGSFAHIGAGPPPTATNVGVNLFLPTSNPNEYGQYFQCPYDCDLVYVAGQMGGYVFDLCVYEGTSTTAMYTQTVNAWQTHSIDNTPHRTRLTTPVSLTKDNYYIVSVRANTTANYGRVPYMDLYDANIAKLIGFWYGSGCGRVSRYNGGAWSAVDTLRQTTLGMVLEPTAGGGMMRTGMSGGFTG